MFADSDKRREKRAMISPESDRTQLTEVERDGIRKAVEQRSLLILPGKE